MAGLVIFPLLYWAFHEYGLLDPFYQAIGLSGDQLLLILPVLLVASLINIPLSNISTWSDVLNNPVKGAFNVQTERSIAIHLNLAGAIVPVVFTLYLIITFQFSIPIFLIGVFIVSLTAYLTSRIDNEIGILVTPQAALVASMSAVMLEGDHPEVWAYSCAVLGTLIGGDIMNLLRLGNMRSSSGSIGGAGILDGIFMFGLFAAALVSVFGNLPGSSSGSAPAEKTEPELYTPLEDLTLPQPPAAHQPDQIKCELRTITGPDGVPLLTNECDTKQ